MYVCLCKAITDHQIIEAVQQGVADLPSLESSLGVSTGCGTCRDMAQELIEQALADTAHPTQTRPLFSAA